MKWRKGELSHKRNSNATKRQGCAGVVLAPARWVPQTRTINTRVLFPIQGPDTLHFIVWCYGVRQTRPKIIIHDRAPMFDLTISQRILGNLHEVRSRQVCPTSLGAGCLRLRQWLVSYLRTTVRARHEFDGPELAEMFERISVLRLNDFFQASRGKQRSRRLP